MRRRKMNWLGGKTPTPPPSHNMKRPSKPQCRLYYFAGFSELIRPVRSIAGGLMFFASTLYVQQESVNKNSTLVTTLSSASTLICGRLLIAFTLRDDELYLRIVSPNPLRLLRKVTLFEVEHQVCYLGIPQLLSYIRETFVALVAM